MDRQLIDYLPGFVQEYGEMAEIMKSEQVVVSNLWDNLEKVMNEAFISTESEFGASIWEEILGLTPSASDTLEERNFNIMTHLCSNLPYTWRNLHIMMTALCGAGGYTLQLTKDDGLTLKVQISLTNLGKLESVKDLLDRIVPANILLDAIQRYNPHSLVGTLTHQGLHKYTHKQIREDQIFGERKEPTYADLSAYTWNKLSSHTWREVERGGI